MTDDLVGRLRSYADTCTGLEPRRIITEAADHIAGTGKLVARIEALEGENGKLREALEAIADHPGSNADDACWSRVEDARAALTRSHPMQTDAEVAAKVRLNGERQRYTVQARNDRFVILTKPFNAQRTYLYTIADLERGVRGPCNLIFGLPCDVNTPSGASEALAMIEAGKMDVSSRRCVPLSADDVAALASAPAGDGVEDDAALLADANGWYSQAQVDDMERDSRGCLACKCGDYPRPSGNYVMPDDGWRSMWCQGCMEHVVGWCASEAEAIQKWNAQRSTELTTPPAAALARPRAAVGEQNREAIARLIWNDRHPTGASWDDWERHIAANGGFDGRDSCRRLADRILALQSPPAKVEG